MSQTRNRKKNPPDPAPVVDVVHRSLHFLLAQSIVSHPETTLQAKGLQQELKAQFAKRTAPAAAADESAEEKKAEE